MHSLNQNIAIVLVLLSTFPQENLFLPLLLNFQFIARGKVIATLLN